MVERFVMKDHEMKADPGDYWVAPRYVYAAELERLAASMRSAIAHLDQPVLHSGSSGDGTVGILRGDINVALAVMRSALGPAADSAPKPTCNHSLNQGTTLQRIENMMDCTVCGKTWGEIAAEKRGRMADHPTEDDFQHFLSYSGLGSSYQRLGRDVIDLRVAYYTAAGIDVTCSTCNGTGEVDLTLGGIHTSDPHAPCPDCTSKTEGEHQ